MLMGFSIIHKPFWGTPIYRNPHIEMFISFYIQNLKIWAEGQSDMTSLSKTERPTGPRIVFQSTHHAKNMLQTAGNMILFF